METVFWRVFASPRTTAVIAVAMAALAMVAAVVPQGEAAITLARYEHSEDVQRLIAWGLTDVVGSPWLKALAVLLLGNVVAVVLTSRWTTDGDEAADAPARAPEDTKIEAPRPEAAVETLRETFRTLLGAPPTAEKVDGSRVTMSFRAGAEAGLAPLWAHLGLVLLVAGAAWASRPPPPSKQAVRAVLDVKDSRTGTVGVFDIVEGETRQFFQWRAQYILRDYAASKDGLGPAVRIERLFPDQRRRDDFWVYQEAPPNFDERHRKGFVSITPRKLGLVPVPGAGLASSGAAVMLLVGLGLLLYGAAAGSQAQGQLWIDVDGRDVRLLGTPTKPGDPLFSQAFQRWDVMARAVLSE